jgi:uncharacterized protein
MTTMHPRVVRSEDSIWVLTPGNALRAENTPEYVGWSDADIIAELPDLAGADIAGTGVHHVTVTTTTSCNLACPYCFQNTAPADGGGLAPRIARRFIDLSVIRAAAQFVNDRAGKHNAHSLALTLFGGEPLLRPDLCATILREFGSFLPLSASAVTNGTRLSARTLASLRALGLDQLQVSLDGGKSSHDVTRRTRGGRPTYDHVLENIRKAAMVEGVLWNFRLNVTASSVSTILSAVEDIASLSFAEAPVVSLDLIHDAGVYDGTVAWGDDALDACVEAYERAIDLGLQIPEPAWSAPCAMCGYVESETGTVVDADGSVVSCWEAVGHPQLKLGDVWGAHLSPEKRRARWRQCGFSATDGAPQRRIRSDLDARVLDLLHEKGRLGTGSTESGRTHG